jgi:hypothetical protein
MATKTTFTQEEWQLLMESVMLSGMAVTAAAYQRGSASPINPWKFGSEDPCRH